MDHIITRDLTFLKVFPILVAMVLCADKFRDKTVHFWCDTHNQVVVQVINPQSSHPKGVMRLVRRTVLHCLTHSVMFTAKYVPGVTNEVAGALSHFQIHRFCAFVSEAAHYGTPHYHWSCGALEMRDKNGNSLVIVTSTWAVYRRSMEGFRTFSRTNGCLTVPYFQNKIVAI